MHFVGLFFLKSLLHLVGSSVLLYLADDARSNKNQHVSSIYFPTDFIMTFIPFISFLLNLWKERKREQCMVQPRVVHDAIGRGAGGGGVDDDDDGDDDGGGDDEDDDDDDDDGGFSNVLMQTIRHYNHKQRACNLYVPTFRLSMLVTADTPT